MKTAIYLKGNYRDLFDAPICYTRRAEIFFYE